MAWAPFMGLFVARISGGRTIREVIVGVVVGGSLACWAGFSILGHTTMQLNASGNEEFTALLEQAKAGEAFDGAQAVVALLHSLPLALPIAIVFFVLTFIFVATSLDSAAFALFLRIQRFTRMDSHRVGIDCRGISVRYRVEPDVYGRVAGTSGGLRSCWSAAGRCDDSYGGVGDAKHSG